MRISTLFVACGMAANALAAETDPKIVTKNGKLFSASDPSLIMPFDRWLGLFSVLGQGQC